MALNRQEKAAVIEEITGQLASAQAVVVAEYRGLSVESVTQAPQGSSCSRCLFACSEEHVGKASHCRYSL